MYSILYLKYYVIYGDKTSNRYVIIKHSYQPQLGSGLQNNRYVFLPCDQDELVDQFEVLCFEKGGNDNHMLNQQILANTDKLLQLECFTTNQH